MATKINNEPITQMYDYSEVEKLYKIVTNFWGSHRIVVCEKTIKNESRLLIEKEYFPDVIICDDKHYKLLEVE